jgi:soluble lytic murein transglycosylase-like protein
MCRAHYRQGIKLIVIFLIVFSGNAHAQFPVKKPPVDYYSTKYDDYFRKYTKRYFSAFTVVDWRWFKSQAIVESALKPNAKSRVGAQGVMQIMPGTWKDIRKKQPWIFDDVWDPRWNIASGIYYNKYLWDVWKADRAWIERLKFTFGSYNCGVGNVLKAQRRCAYQCTAWSGVERYVPRETYHYVNRIFKLMAM